MTFFSSDELILITLYSPGSRKGTIDELHDMINCLMPDETALLNLVKGVIGKLEAISDETFDEMSEAMTPDYSLVFTDEDSAWGASVPVWLDEANPDDDIE